MKRATPTPKKFLSSLSQTVLAAVIWAAVLALFTVIGWTTQRSSSDGTAAANLKAASAVTTASVKSASFFNVPSFLVDDDDDDGGNCTIGDDDDDGNDDDDDGTADNDDDDDGAGCGCVPGGGDADDDDDGGDDNNGGDGAGGLGGGTNTGGGGDDDDSGGGSADDDDDGQDDDDDGVADNDDDGDPCNQTCSDDDDDGMGDDDDGVPGNDDDDDGMGDDDDGTPDNDDDGSDDDDDGMGDDDDGHPNNDDDDDSCVVQKVDVLCVPGPGVADGNYGYTNITTGQVCDPNDVGACDPARAGEVLRYRIKFRNEAASTVSATGLTLKAYFPGDVDSDGDVDLKFDTVNGASCSPACSSTSFTDPTVSTWGGAVTFNLNSLGAGNEVEVEFHLKVQSSPPDTPSVRNLFAEVFSMNQDDDDSTPGNLGKNVPKVQPVLNGEDDECGLVTLLPVELTLFKAELDGRDALLRWQTASETNNAGFEVQHRAGESTQFESLGFVEGAGTTLETQTYTFRVDDLTPGRHVFRLKQIDFDGAFEYSPEVEVSVEMPAAYFVSSIYPNPFNPEATLQFAVRQSQQVRVSVYNMLGQRVLELYQGVPSAGVTQTVLIDGSRLVTGTYMVQIVGEQFIETQTITLIK